MDKEIIILPTDISGNGISGNGISGNDFSGNGFIEVINDIDFEELTKDL